VPELTRRGGGASSAPPLSKGLASAAVAFARSQGYRLDELVEIIEEVG
jgi:hypothetical protein